jgi:hypothetical protein
MCRMNGRSAWRAAFGLVAAGLLAGCATSGDTAATLMTAPGGYDFYSCPQLAQTAASLKLRRTELEHLMAKAESDAGGRVMSAIGYRPDYLKTRGALHEVERTARDKQCDMSIAPAKPPAPPRAASTVPARAKPR